MSFDEIARRLVEYAQSTDRADAEAVVAAELEEIARACEASGRMSAVEAMRRELCDHIEDAGYVGCCLEEHVRAALGEP